MHILDLACGKGRHSIFLNSLGYRVTGMDLSPQSIAYAGKWANDKLDFEEHDMREALAPSKYDVILNLFTSFGYFEDEKDNERVVQAMYTGLKQEGIVIIDFMNSVKVLVNLVEAEEKVVDDIVFKITRELKNRFIVKTISFEDEGRQYQFTEKVKPLDKATFLQYFDKTGFEVSHIWGDYNLNDYDEDHSDRLIIKLKKK